MWPWEATFLSPEYISNSVLFDQYFPIPTSLWPCYQLLYSLFWFTWLCKLEAKLCILFQKNETMINTQVSILLFCRISSFYTCVKWRFCIFMKHRCPIMASTHLVCCTNPRDAKISRTWTILCTSLYWIFCYRMALPPNPGITK